MISSVMPWLCAGSGVIVGSRGFDQWQYYATLPQLVNPLHRSVVS
jgi:hypothetical protein